MDLGYTLQDIDIHNSSAYFQREIPTYKTQKLRLERQKMTFIIEKPRW